MKTMCPPGYHHNGFVATHALGHIMGPNRGSWVRIPLGPTFYIESKNLSSK